MSAISTIARKVRNAVVVLGLSVGLLGGAAIAANAATPTAATVNPQSSVSITGLAGAIDCDGHGKMVFNPPQLQNMGASSEDVETWATVLYWWGNGQWNLWKVATEESTYTNAFGGLAWTAQSVSVPSGYYYAVVNYTIVTGQTSWTSVLAAADGPTAFAGYACLE